MYIPRTMRMDELSQQQQFIQQFGFATIVSEDLQISHLPLYIKPDEADIGVIYGHMAKANPQWKVMQQAKVKAIFNGPHSYISPNWYADAPAVPTWNYAAVHACGIASLLDTQQTLNTAQTLVQQYEPELLNNDNLMPLAYQQKLASAIVGFKIELTTLEGKLKLGQHRSQGDQRGVVAGLSKSQHLDAAALLAYMRQIDMGLG